MNCPICSAGKCTCKPVISRPLRYPPVGTMISTQSINSARPGAAHYVAPRRLYLDKEGRVVEANDPARVELLVPEGGILPRYRAQALGLVGEDTEGEPAKPVGEAQAQTAPVSTPEAKSKIATK